MSDTPKADKAASGRLRTTALFGRLLFVYVLNGVVKCFSADEIRPLQSAMLDIGWKHTATIDPARWIEAMANGKTEPSDMLDELQFCPPNAEVTHPESPLQDGRSSAFHGATCSTSSRRFRCKTCGEKCRSSNQDRGKRKMCRPCEQRYKHEI